MGSPASNLAALISYCLYSRLHWYKVGVKQSCEFGSSLYPVTWQWEVRAVLLCQEITTDWKGSWAQPKSIHQFIYSGCRKDNGHLIFYFSFFFFFPSAIAVSLLLVALQSFSNTNKDFLKVNVVLTMSL